MARDARCPGASYSTVREQVHLGWYRLVWNVSFLICRIGQTGGPDSDTWESRNAGKSPLDNSVAIRKTRTGIVRENASAR